MDFGKVVEVKSLVSAVDLTATINCKCAKCVKLGRNACSNMVNNIGCDESKIQNKFKASPEPGDVVKTLEYKPNQKISLKNCEEPVWVFAKDTVPSGTCEALFRDTCTPPEETANHVMCGGKQIAAFDAYAAGRQVRL